MSIISNSLINTEKTKIYGDVSLTTKNSIERTITKNAIKNICKRLQTPEVKKTINVYVQKINEIENNEFLRIDGKKINSASNLDSLYILSFEDYDSNLTGPYEYYIRNELVQLIINNMNKSCDPYLASIVSCYMSDQYKYLKSSSLGNYVKACEILSNSEKSEPSSFLHSIIMHSTFGRSYMVKKILKVIKTDVEDFGKLIIENENAKNRKILDSLTESILYNLDKIGRLKK